MRDLPTEGFSLVYDDDRPILLTQMGINKVAISRGHDPEGTYTTLEFARYSGENLPIGTPLPEGKVGDIVHIINFHSLEALQSFHSIVGDLLDEVEGRV